MIVGPRRPEAIGAVTTEPASVLTYKDDPRSHAARSAEQIEPTDALFAGKVQHRRRQKIAAIPAAQASCRDPGTRPELRFPPSQLERE